MGNNYITLLQKVVQKLLPVAWILAALKVQGKSLKAFSGTSQFFTANALQVVDVEMGLLVLSFIFQTCRLHCEGGIYFLWK